MSWSVVMGGRSDVVLAKTMVKRPKLDDDGRVVREGRRVVLEDVEEDRIKGHREPADVRRAEEALVEDLRAVAIKHGASVAWISTDTLGRVELLPEEVHV